MHPSWPTPREPSQSFSEHKWFGLDPLEVQQVQSVANHTKTPIGNYMGSVRDLGALPMTDTVDLDSRQTLEPRTKKDGISYIMLHGSCLREQAVLSCERGITKSISAPLIFPFHLQVAVHQ